MYLRKSKETNYCKKVAKVFMFLVLLTSQSFTKLPKTKRIFKLFKKLFAMNQPYWLKNNLTIHAKLKNHLINL